MQRNEAERTEVLLLYITTGLRVLSARVVLLLALALTFSLFAWAMYMPDYNRIGCATIFAILIFLPATRVDARVSGDRAVISPEKTDG